MRRGLNSSQKFAPSSHSTQLMTPLDHHKPLPSHTGQIMSEKRGCVKSTAKSLNTLRQILQTSINEEIDDIMQKYIQNYLEPVADNLEFNQRNKIIPTNGMPPKQYIKSLCRQILEEAKKMY